jgi:predicted nuclease of predicted toxin-antitoxin system
LRFLVDEQLPQALAGFLREQGHEAEHVRDIALAGSADKVLWNMAIERGMVIVSKDEDFPQRAWLRDPHPQIIWVRWGNVSNPAFLTRFSGAWPLVLKSIEAGESVVELR